MMTIGTNANALEVVVKKNSTASIEAAWAEIGAFCDIAKWHPAVEKCEQSIQNGVTYRNLFLKGGGEVFEKQTEFNNSSKSYSYTIEKSPLPVQNYSAQIKAEAGSAGTTLVWEARFDAKGVSDEEAQKTISGIFEAGLGSIIERLNK